MGDGVWKQEWGGVWERGRCWGVGAAVDWGGGGLGVIVWWGVGARVGWGVGAGVGWAVSEEWTGCGGWRVLG